MRGQFIVFEGPDGSGTTTHSRFLVEALQAQGMNVLHTFEATDGPIGTVIRSELRSGGLPASSMQLLFTADRAWHVEKVIEPALAAGTIVICDRYSLSTELYGTALGLDRTWLHDMNGKFIQPDMMILALPPFETCMERLGRRDKDTFEANDSLQHRVYDLYKEHAENNPGMTAVDTAGSKEETAQKINDAVHSFLSTARS